MLFFKTYDKIKNMKEKEEFDCCLKQLGLADEEAERFFSAGEAGDKETQLCILNCLRQRKLTAMHGLHKDLECIDYLIAQVERGDQS